MITNSSNSNILNRQDTFSGHEVVSCVITASSDSLNS